MSPGLGRRVAVKHPDGTVYGQSSNPEWESQDHPIAEYDELGRVQVQYDERGATTTMVYDILGRTIQTIDALGHVMETEYDVAGQRVKTIDALGREVEFTYDPFGRLAETKFPQADGASPVNTFKRTTYDKRGQAIAEEDQNGNVTEFGFDALGRLESVTDAEEHTWTYGYDEAGAQTSQTDANDHTTNWTYDKHGRKLTRTLPMGQTETFHYDIAGNMFEHHRFDHEEFVHNSVMMYDFDGSGREVGRFDPEISTSTVTTAYDLAGRRVKVDDNLGTTRYEYDLRGRLTAEIKFSGEALVYEYDQQGNQTRSLVYSDDSRTTELMETVKTYDRLNRLETVASDPGTWTYQYNEVGSRAAQINPNGTRTDYEYDDLNRLRKIHTYKDNASPTPDVDINLFEYTLDNVGNRIKIEEYQNTGTSIVEARLDYLYDDTYKLLSEERTDKISEDQVYLRVYEYDPVGNRLLQRTSVEGIVQEERTYPAETAYDANDRLLEERVDDEVVTTYQYDDRGNTTAKLDAVNSEESVFYTWDHRNRLIRVDRGETIEDAAMIATYDYDAFGTRVRKSVGPSPADNVTYLIDYNNGTRYSQNTRETDGSGDMIVCYHYGEDLLSQIRLDVPGYLGEPVPFLYHYDGLGSTRDLSYTNAEVAGSYSFYGFGEIFGEYGTISNDYLFAGEQLDQSIGFYNLRARFYNPSSGRFQGLDPHGGYNRDPASLHKYLYANGNPINRIDPLGLMSLSENNVVAAIQMTLVTMNLQGAAVNLKDAIQYTFSMLRAFKNGDYWDGLIYGGAAAFASLLTGVNILGAYVSLKIPPSFGNSGMQVALAANGPAGASAMWSTVVSAPVVAVWLVEAAGPIFITLYKNVNGLGEPVETHHKIPYENGSYEFQDHPLVEAAEVDLQYDARNQMRLGNHRGRHSTEYLNEVEARLDDGWERLGPNPSRSEAQRAYEIIADDIDKDIETGVLKPYKNKEVYKVK